MSPSSICLNRTVACLVRTSLPRQLWRPCKITLPTITRYVGYISLLLTCGGQGSTTLPGPERLLSQKQSGVHPWHQTRQEAAGSSGAMADGDSTEVVYKIRQWSLPGATVVPVLNVSSRVFWLELDDKALLDSYTVLQEGILCDVFSQKCSAAWQGAPGQRLTVAIMLPGRQDADDWLNFMLSQKNLWPTFATRGTLTEEISEQTFRKERRRLQAKHLWMEVRLSWHVLAGRMYTSAPTGKSREQLYALLFDKASRGSQKNPYEEKAYR